MRYVLNQTTGVFQPSVRTLINGIGNLALEVTCDSVFAGQVISATKGSKILTQICPSTSPYKVRFEGVEPGTWTISGTVEDNTFTTDVVVQDISAVLNYGFVWSTWVGLSQTLDSSDYSSLDDLLEDEEAIRELMTIHDCVDYLAQFEIVTPDLEKIINNDLCAKWINLRDYALDTLYANSNIKSIMDEADKYGYGEWALVGQVPKMTSNSAPYGEAFANGTLGLGYDAYKAFDGANDSSGWAVNGDGSNVGYIGYHFPTPQRISKVYMANRNEATPRAIKKFKIQGSNTGNTNDYHDISVELTNPSSSQAVSNTYDISATSTEAYSYIRLFITDVYDTSYYGIGELQFYAWVPKGNVPIMTANNAPYGAVSANAELSGNEAYKVFDGTESYWQSNTTSGTYIGYRFTNPVCVKRFKLCHYNTIYSMTKVVIQASNNNFTTYTEFAVGDLVNDTLPHYYDIDNTNYYLAYRVAPVTTQSPTAVIEKELQFYGRELPVSVPKMISNSAPYGTVYSDYGDTNTYNAFDGDATTNGSTSLIVNQSATVEFYIGYANVKAYRANGFYVVSDLASLNLWRINTCKIYGTNNISDSSSWVELASFSNVDNGYHDFQNDNEYTTYIAKFNATNLTSQHYGARISELQFYGLDHSEKEFEEGTNKKWLYDHGVELETATAKVQGNGVARKDSSELYVEVSAASQKGDFAFPSIDLTSYSLLRAKNGDKCYHSGGSFAGYELNLYSTDDPSYSAAPTSQRAVVPSEGGLPNNIGLDISSLNTTYYIHIISRNNTATDTHYGNVKELWLE